MSKLNEILGEHFKQIPEDIQKKYKNVDLVDSTNYVEKKEFDNATATIEQYKNDIKKRDKDLLDLQGKIKDNKELNDEIERLREDNRKSSEDYEAKLNQVKFDAKFDKAIAGYKAKNPKALKALLDMDKVKLVDDTFIGLEEQIKALKESDTYLFEGENKGGTGSIGGSSSNFEDGGDNNEENSIGAILGKQQADQSKENEVLNNFFK